MHISSLSEIQNPLKNSQGETIYELVGNAARSGNATYHSLAVIVIPPGCSSEPHFHKVGEETYYILSGIARMQINEKEFTLSTGQACLIQPYERHQITNSEDEDLQFIAICAPAWTAADSFPVS